MFTQDDLDALEDDNVKKDIDATVDALEGKAGNPVRAKGEKLIVGQEFTIHMPMPKDENGNQPTVGDAFQALLTEHKGDYPYTGIQTVEGREISLAQLLKPGTGLFKRAAKTAKDGARLLMLTLYKDEHHTIRIKFVGQIPMLSSTAGEQYTIREWKLIE